ncbi:2-amino-4-hydroxy-6-hydroxymethyldihydropteridine diphosphokinase [Shewanella gelidii]|uniref:2-amino-4-hydroxy-6-hydroxymethyldihydropteridine pyrophosphokinase n=1 Tax=Shewanella gelidii TaxID=1642821 RepID=A0A917JJ24_9GAMM|nr:2-amino-4-hydroxy-6-hydroxymethyldihydropteridine diphosphokinase [Shewanella gelidii]MCL1096872.1 2-amino-4-hydroxy-6-hydroxymethyldihydropteridine diphosphokinase [Shewanella gelidii]GGI70789.1 2-amino-4-hydroxy-6-hydroxymethyldihydropteridine diphosphokinase [Shewanella gelidii]
MIKVFVALGANLEQPIQQLQSAVSALTAIAESEAIEVSNFYQSTPMGDVIQPDYINAVASFETTQPPLALLDQLQAIENNQGRVRIERWGPRTLDLDLLLYGDQTVDHPRLTIPHYGMKQRSFVLIPLADLVPQLILPCGTSIKQLISTKMRSELQQVHLDH